jgi:teichuronic acid biosynthesis glycosyltransferase TuaC
MRRIAVVTRYFPSSAEPWQGRSAYQTLRILARESEVRVFYPNANYPALLRPRTRTYANLDLTYQPAEVAASYYNYPALPLISRPFNGQLAARVLLPHVRAFAPDVIFSVFLYPDGYAALRIGHALSVPVVAMGIGSDINNIGDRISAKYTRTLLREVDFLVTVSDDLRQKAVAMGARPERSRAIINGCDLSVFHPRNRHDARRQLNLNLDAPSVVYIGRMDLRKGLRELVEAAASMHAARPNLQFYLLGEGPDRPAVNEAIAAHAAAEYVHALPGCAPDDVAMWMSAADVVTLPSYMEGCPNAVLEALACGRPMVATRVGGIPEIMGDDCGRLVPARDPAALADALGAVLDQHWDADAISAHWSRSWTTVAAELNTVLEQVIQDRGR